MNPRVSHSAGDILIFLPGERVREVADHLRKHLAHQPPTRNAEVLPLFATFPSREQGQFL
jgi:ATP-dependent helicase HrpA